MSPSDRPAPTPFDPEASGLPASLGSLVAGSDRVPALLLVAGAGARAGGWAARAAIALASTLGEEGQRIVLAELAAASPELHDALGVRNDEGMADVFLFGASLRRVARAVAGHTFYFAPAGEYVPDAGTLLSHPRWERLIGGFVEAEAMLLIYVRAGTPGLDALAGRAGHAVVLAGSDEADVIASGLPDGCSVDAVLSPPADAGDLAIDTVPGPFEAAETPDAPATAAAGPAEADVSDFAEVDFDVEPEFEPADPVEAERAGTGVTPPAEDAAGPGELDESAPAVSAELGAAAAGDPGRAEYPAEDELIRELAAIHRESERRRSTLVLIAVVLLVGLAVAGWFVLGRSGGEEDPAPPSEPASAEPASTEPAAMPAARPIDSPLPYSVVIESHQDAATASRLVAELRTDEPDIGFYIAPVLVNDAVYHRVLGGPAADSASARSLMQRLVEIGVKEEAQPWAVRNTAYAFHLGDFDTRDAAGARADELAEVGIPAYVIEVPFDAGPPRFRLYVGAYQGPAEARVLARMLREQGLDPELIPRIGRPAS